MSLSRETKRLIYAVSIVVVVIGAIAIITLRGGQEEQVLNIYSYDSLMKWGYDETSEIGTPYDEIYASVFSAFEQSHGISIKLTEFEDTGAMIEQLVREKESPIADVVIGIDNLDIFTLKAENILEPYTPSTLDNIPAHLVAALDPDHYLVPYDFGVIALAYDQVALDEVKYPEIRDSFTFADLTLEKYRSTFIVENPLTSSPGKAFLMWQIGIFEKVLGLPWQDWWVTMKEDPGVFIASGWTEAFSRVFFEETDDHIVVSYGTDLAYNAFFGYDSNANISLNYELGNTYSWFQVEGLGLINNAHHENLAKDFIDWFLTEDVQSYIATSNWMFPANQYVDLPSEFEANAVHPDRVSLVNTLFSQNEIETNLKSWLIEWQSIVVS